MVRLRSPQVYAKNVVVADKESNNYGKERFANCAFIGSSAYYQGSASDSIYNCVLWYAKQPALSNVGFTAGYSAIDTTGRGSINTTNWFGVMSESASPPPYKFVSGPSTQDTIFGADGMLGGGDDGLLFTTTGGSYNYRGKLTAAPWVPNFDILDKPRNQIGGKCTIGPYEQP